MNAQTKGRENGFTYCLSVFLLNKTHFEAVGIASAQKAYKRPEKQDEFIQGWMENWHDPHAQDCTCQECQNAPEVLTY